MAEARVEVSHIPTALQKADVMTKPLARIQFLRARQLLAMTSPSSCLPLATEPGGV